MRRKALVALVSLPLLLPGLARADDVADAIAEAARAYRSGDIPATRTALGDALQFLSQRAAALLGAALPAALPGWQAMDVEASSAGLGLLGGGSQAKRRYENAQGQDVEIQVTADSPLISALGMAMTNPALAGAMGKLIRIGNQRAIQTSDNDIQMLVDNRILVAISGTAPVEAKLAYANAIDLAKLAAPR